MICPRVGKSLIGSCLLYLTATTAAAQAPATSAATRLSTQPVSAPAAPYVALPAGTSYEYSNFKTTITRSQGWRSWFSDAMGRPGLHVGVFINDNPKQPGKIVQGDLAELWPLKIGNDATVMLERAGGIREQWRVSVNDTATIKVPLGTVFTYHVKAMQAAAQLPKGTAPYVNLYDYWYAPAWAAVVRVRFVGVSGPAQGRIQDDQIVFIRRPKG